MNSTERRKWVLLVPLAVPIFLGMAILACAAPSGDGDGFGVRNNYYLRHGDNYDGDQVIVANNIHLESGSSVEGDVTLVGRKADVDAAVQGDVVVVANRLDVGENAVISGDLTICVNDFTRNDAAQINGEIKRECSDSRQVSIQNVFRTGVNDWQNNFFLRLSSTFVGALFLGAIAALSSIFFPRPLSRMARAMHESPFTTGGMGCLTVLVAIGLTGAYALSLLLVLPLILLPFVLLGWILIGFASLLGWVALAEPFGRAVLRILRMYNQPPMIAAVVGGIALSLIIRVWSLFWFTGWITVVATILLSAFGIGAAVLTRLGTRPYPHAAQQVVRSTLE